MSIEEGDVPLEILKECTVRKRFHFVLLGHVDSGKSTVAGHLIFKLGGVSKIFLERIERNAQEIGKGSFKYAFIIDRLRSERERGITINAHFWNLSERITLIDVPGHRDFIKNVVTGISLADVGLLVVDSCKGGFEAGILELSPFGGYSGQTKNHLLLAYSHGIGRLVIAVNKMDGYSTQYSERRFDEIRDILIKILLQVGYNPDLIPIIPISGWTGENLTEKVTNMKDWWKRGKTKWGGKTLLEVLNSIETKEIQSLQELPLRIPILDVFKITHIGTVVTGKVVSGILRRGMKIIISPPGRTSVVKSIEIYHQRVENAFPGDVVGIHIPDIAVLSSRGTEIHGFKNIIRRGFVCSEVSNPPKITVKFESKLVFIKKGDGEVKRIGKVGWEPMIDCHTCHRACRLLKINKKLVDEKTDEWKSYDDEEENMENTVLRSGETYIVVFAPLSGLMVVEEFRKFPSLGRFSVREGGALVATGYVEKVYSE